MPAPWKDDIITAFSNIGGIATYEQLYAEIKTLRPNLPRSWKKIVQRQIQDLSSDSEGYRFKEDLFFSVQGKGLGVWGLRGSIKLSPMPSDFPQGNVAPDRIALTTFRVLRDTELARSLKQLYKNKCQICRQTIALWNEECYSEAHHVRPLGHPHDGSDTADNILVLCPNHHVMFDYGAIRFEPDKLHFLPGHWTSQKNITYHNNVIALPIST